MHVVRMKISAHFPSNDDALHMCSSSSAVCACPEGDLAPLARQVHQSPGLVREEGKCTRECGVLAVGWRVGVGMGGYIAAGSHGPEL